MSDKKDKRIQLVWHESLLTLVNNWRRSQPHIPSVNEGIAVLVKKGLQADGIEVGPEDGGVDRGRRV